MIFHKFLEQLLKFAWPAGDMPLIQIFSEIQQICCKAVTINIGKFNADSPSREHDL